MKKIILSFLLFSTLCAFSQSKISLKMGKEIDDQSSVKNGNKEILECNNNIIFFIASGSVGKITNNDHLAGKYTPNKKAEILHTVVTDDNVIQLSLLDWKLKKTTLSKANLASLMNDQVIKDYNAFSKGHYFLHKTAISQNKEYSAISMILFNKENYITSILVLLFDKDLDILKEQKINYNFGEKSISMNNLTVDDSGKAILALSSSTKKRNDDQLEVCVVSEEDEEFISIPLNGNHLVDYIAQFDKQGNILVAGYFGSDDGKSTTATFSTSIEFTSKTVGDLHFIKFPSDYDAARPQFDTYYKRFRYSVKAKEILFSKDNSAYLIGYEYILFTVSGMGASLNPGSYQYSRDVLLTKISEDAIPEKLLFVNSSTLAQSSGEAAPKSFYAVEDEGSIYVVYVDHVNNYNGKKFALVKDLYLFPIIGYNKGVCLIAMIDSDGNLEQEYVYNNAQDNVGVLLINSLIFDPAKKCFTGFMAEKWGFTNKLSTPGLKTVEISLP